MDTVNKLKKYASQSGLPDVIADENTLILSTEIISLQQLEAKEAEKKGLDYYMNLEYPYKFHNKKSSNGFDIYCCGNGVFIVEGSRLVMFVPVYECHGTGVNKNIVSITGHETTATVVLNDLPASFSYHTR